MKQLLIATCITLSSLSMQAEPAKTKAPEATIEAVSASHSVKGLICDKNTGETLAGATITANGQKVYSDLDGNFKLDNLCSGKCQLKVTLISYKEQTIELETGSNRIHVKLELR